MAYGWSCSGGGTLSGVSGDVAGWYPDPSGEPQQRFWDGAKWTTDTRPYPAPTARPSHDTAVGTSGQASRATGSSHAGRTIALIGVLAVLVAAAAGGLVVWRQSVDQSARDAAEAGAQVGGPPMSDVEELFCPDGPNTDTSGTGIDCSGTGPAPAPTKPSPSPTPSENAELDRICSRLASDMSTIANAWYETYPRKSYPEAEAIEALAKTEPSALPLIAISQDMHALGLWVRSTADNYYNFLVELNQRPLPTLSMSLPEAKASARGSRNFALKMGLAGYANFIQMATSSFEGAEAGPPPVSLEALKKSIYDACP